MFQNELIFNCMNEILKQTLEKIVNFKKYLKYSYSFVRLSVKNKINRNSEDHRRF